MLSSVIKVRPASRHYACALALLPVPLALLPAPLALMPAPLALLPAPLALLPAHTPYLAITFVSHLCLCGICACVPVKHMCI